MGIETSYEVYLQHLVEPFFGFGSFLVFEETMKSLKYASLFGLLAAPVSAISMEIDQSQLDQSQTVSNASLAANYFGNKCDVYGGEPLEADDAYRSLISGKIETNETANTIADGLRTQLGDKNFPIIKEHVKAIIRVTEEDIISAMRIVYERMKIIIEPSSAVAFAALLKEKELFKNKKIGIIVSGGNVDVNNLPF